MLQHRWAQSQRLRFQPCMSSNTFQRGGESTKRPPFSRHQLLAAASPDWRGPGLTELARTAAAAVLAAALTLGIAEPATAAANTAVLKGLQKYQIERADTSAQSRGFQAVQHLQGSLQQLDRVVVLVQLGKYDAARLQLREGAFRTLRLDLGYGAEMYRIITPQSVKDAVNQIEGLDRALKAHADVEQIRQMTDALGAGIRRTAELLQIAEAEAW